MTPEVTGELNHIGTLTDLKTAKPKLSGQWREKFPSILNTVTMMGMCSITFTLCPSAENHLSLLIFSEPASDQVASVMCLRKRLQGKQYNTSACDQNL